MNIIDIRINNVMNEFLNRFCLIFESWHINIYEACLVKFIEIIALFFYSND